MMNLVKYYRHTKKEEVDNAILDSIKIESFSKEFHLHLTKVFLSH